MQKVILCEGCEVLKLVAGLIVREVWPAGPPVTDPWFSASDLKIHAKFPKSGSQSSQWILAFESYIYDLITESQISRL